MLAIKILPASFARDPARMARFEREAKALTALNHAHIAQIYGVEEGGLVMELVAREPLKEPLPTDKVVQYAGQILDALDSIRRYMLGDELAAEKAIGYRVGTIAGMPKAAKHTNFR